MTKEGQAERKQKSKIITTKNDEEKWTKGMGDDEQEGNKELEEHTIDQKSRRKEANGRSNIREKTC